jgi:hypothetical protein
MTSSARYLFLFSSDQSPLYTQDVLNVLGAPAGHHHTFRYEQQYLGAGVADAWADLRDRRVLVVFSLQQHARYHAPAFIPIRFGRVVATSREGEHYFVEFRLERYASLLAPPLRAGKEFPSERVQEFTQALSGLVEVPYAASASLGDSLPDETLDQEAADSVRFARTAKYLSQTAAFASARFVRVLGIKPSSGSEGDRLKTTITRPSYELEAGRTYDLEIFHTQPVAPPSPEPFVLDVDGTVLRVVGRAGFDVASRYDLVTLPLAATEAGGLEDRATVATLRPGPGVQGAEIVLRIVIRARRERAVGIAGLQALALVGVALASTLDMWPLGARVALAVVAAFAAVALGLLGDRTLSPPTLPSATKPDPAPSETSPAHS